jgi:hypothetical protein
MRYYDLQKNWAKVILPHLADKELQRILVRDFNKFTMGSWGKPFKAGELPREWETCGWSWEQEEEERDLDPDWEEPAYWSYVKHAGCHWIVNFSLKLAMLALPKRQWRIITTELHSTVWDGKTTLFDFNFQALGVPPLECFKNATAPKLNPKQLPVGKLMRVFWPPSREEMAAALKEIGGTDATK